MVVNVNMPLSNMCIVGGQKMNLEEYKLILISFY